MRKSDVEAQKIMLSFVLSFRKLKSFEYNWFSRLVEADRITYTEEIEAITKEDVKTMFAKTIESMKARYKREGIQEGIQKGIQEGIQKGKLDTARKLKARGFEIKTIIELTGLSRAEINKLKK